jgi:RNA processing factor Prp31
VRAPVRQESASLWSAGIPCVSGDVVQELARGIRMHFPHYVKQLEGHMWRDAQRGLAHSYSRAKVKFNVNRADNMIIQVPRLRHAGPLHHTSDATCSS